jgi:signal transduction histidine kinase
MSRYDSDNMFTTVAVWFQDTPAFPVGQREPPGGNNVMSIVLETGRPARINDYSAASGAIGGPARKAGIRSAVGIPIIVQGRLWGIMTAGSTHSEPLPADTEARLASFTELVSTAIANTEAREAIERLAEEQAASRIRVLTAGDDARRRVVRDLHDGAQQRLVHSIIVLKLARRALVESDSEAKSLVDEALVQAEQANVELRELARGILPSVLIRGGLADGVETVVSRIDLPVDVEIANGRFPAEIEASAYFIIAEALTNVVKHAQATRAEVNARVEDGALLVEIRDDGTGAADPAGQGLVGLADRATALGGRLRVQRLASGGTLVAAVLPLPAASDDESVGEKPVGPPASARS